MKPSLKQSLFNSIRQVSVLQLDFLRILSTHEHFLSLNLPIFPDLNELAQQQQHQVSKQTLAPKIIIESKEFFHRHFLVGLILRSLFKSLHSPFSHIQLKSIELLRNLLESHDLDPRLSSTNVRSRIAYMYFPFINLIIHFIPLMIATQPFKSSFIQTMSNGISGTEIKFDQLNNNQSNNTGSSPNSNPSTTNNGSNFNIDIESFFNEFNLNENETTKKRNGMFDNPIEHCVKEWSFQEFGDIFNEFDVNFLIDNHTKLDRQADNDITDLNYIYTLDDDEQGDECTTELNETVCLESLNKSNLKGKQVVKMSKIEKSLPFSSKSKKDKTSNLFLKKPCSCANLIFGDEQKHLDISNFSLKTTQNILVCFMWILKNIDQKILFHIWSRWSFIKLNKILILIDLCINHFEYRSSVWSTLFEDDSNGLEAKSSGAQSNITNQHQVNTSKSTTNKKQSSNVASNSKFKNKIEDLITGTHNAGSQFMKRSKYNGYGQANSNDTNMETNSESNNSSNTKWLKWKNLITQAQRQTNSSGTSNQIENDSACSLSTSSSLTSLPGNLSYESIKSALEGKILTIDLSS